MITEMKKNSDLQIKNLAVALNDDQQSKEVINTASSNQRFISRYLSDHRNNQNGKIKMIHMKNCKDIYFGSKTETDGQLPQTTKSLSIEDKTSVSPTFVKCKERLKYRYETDFAYMRSFFWKGKRMDFPIKDYFVGLIVEKSSLFGKKEGEKIRVEEIFSKEAKHQTILVTGGPGYGKTTLCKKIAYDWATTELTSHYSKKFDLLVFILLREINDESLYDLVMRNISQNVEEKAKIKEENLNILVILDGFDEMLNKTSVLKFIREESFDSSWRMTILVTSRSQETEKIRELIKSRFSIEGFSEQQQEKYIRLMFEEEQDKGKHLFEMLKESVFYFEIAKCPLMLHMLCCLHLNNDEKINDCITTLYLRIFSLITKRYINKYGGNHNFSEGKYFFGEDLLLRLGKLIQVHKTHLIKSKDLKDYFPVEEEFNFIVGLDVLQFHSFPNNDEDVYYEFVHHSFIEFTIALFVYKNSHCLDFLTTDYSLLFMIGLFDKESFPKKLQEYLMERVFSPKFMIQAYREIKTKRNWELLCSLTDVKFYYNDIDDIETLLTLYKFTKLYMCFPKNEEDYIVAKDKLIDFNKSCNLSDKLVIYIFPVFYPKMWVNVHDLREIASCIIDFFTEIGSVKHKIYFSGIYFINTWFIHFSNVKYSVEIPKRIKETLDDNENEFVALETTYEVEGIRRYLISAEQYKFLSTQIKTFSLLKIEYKCTII